jgi:hypothetical protein
VIEPPSVTVTKVVEPHSTTVSKVSQQHSVTVSRVTETQSATVRKVTELYWANVNEVIYPYSAAVSKVVEPWFNTVSNDCLFITFIIAILSFVLYLLIRTFQGAVRWNFYISRYDLIHVRGSLVRNIGTDNLAYKDSEPRGVPLYTVSCNYNIF